MTCANDGDELCRLIRLVAKGAEAHAVPVHEKARHEGRVIQLDARFERGGAWAGVDRLVEPAYLDLLKMEQHAILEEHSYELYMALPKYRHQITLKYACLTDTVTGSEKTRNFPLDRAYRLVHGLVGLILQWKRAQADQQRWTVIVRNFDHAQHLATRFFVELARRAARQREIDIDVDVIIETQLDQAQLALRAPGVGTVPVAPWINKLELDPLASYNFDESQKDTFEKLAETRNSMEAMEVNYPTLLAYYRHTQQGLPAAEIALRALCLSNHYGYYYESSSFVDTVLEYFDQLATDEESRWNYIGNIFQALVSTGATDRALHLIEERAEPHLKRPALRAKMSYVLSMIYLRYARVPNLALAEEHILRAGEYINAAKNELEPHDFAFFKVFAENGLAFLRVRQGRHQEAMDLCQSGYELLTRELGEERHMLHRSVLQYNTAQVYVMLNRPEDALHHYRKAMQMDPYYSEYYNESGNILQREGRYEEATAMYELAIKYSAPYPEVYFNKGICHMHQEQWQDALACFEFSLELNPDQHEIYVLRAELFDGQGQTDEALADYDKAVALLDNSVVARVNRAVLHFNQGAYELALSDMDHVISLEPEQASHYENRAQIYKAMHREDLYLRDLNTSDKYREFAVAVG